MHVVLVEPQIPPNTGNIARLCAGTDADLHLVGKLGFSLEDRYLKRAGLDYWPNVKLHLHDSLEALFAKHRPTSIAYYSTHADRLYTAFKPTADAWFVFGQETKGLPADVKRDHADDLYKIPITGHVRSLNLANSVAIVLYDALRQHDFLGLDQT